MDQIQRCTMDVDMESMSRFKELFAGYRSIDKLANATATLTLKIKYVVVPLSTAGVISVAQIQANHAVINDNFKAFINGTKAPATDHYPYGSLMSDPNIQFAPTNSTELTEANGHVVYLSQPSGVSSYTSVTDLEQEYVRQGNTIEPGTIHVFISTLQTSGGLTLLGVAKSIVSNACAVHYATVGSPSSPGTLSNYDLGNTLVHELGHCFGLYHPFSNDGDCNSTLTTFINEQNPQSPKQIAPNTYFELDKIASTGNGMDNRGRDSLRFCTGDSSCTIDFPTSSEGLKPGDTVNTAQYSCTTASDLQNGTLPWETGFIFMDYGRDQDMLGFPSDTVSTMRTVIGNNGSLFTQVDGGDSGGGGGSNGSSSFPTWAIIVTAVGGGLLLIGLGVYFGVYYKKKAKASSAYTVPISGLRKSGDSHSHYT